MVRAVAAAHNGAVDSDERNAAPPGVPGFRLLESLGQGGMGSVWLAEPLDPGLPPRVALKLLHEWHADDHRPLRRMQREGDLGRRLGHPHILPVLDVFQHDGRVVLVLPLVDGTSLDAWQPCDEQGRPLPPAAGLRARLACLARVAQALHHAHAQGVVHRDVKPSNVLVERNGHPWLIDFGLAHDDHASMVLTSTQAVVGTPFYMAPELVSGRSRLADARTDVYALGVVAYQLVAGRPPFTGATRERLWQQVLHGEPPRLVDVDPPAPPGLELLLLEALEKDPDHRPPTARAFAERLEQVLAGGASSSDSFTLLRRYTRQVLRRRAALLAVLVVLLGAFAWQVGRARARAQAELALSATLAEGDRELANGDLDAALASYARATEEHPTDPRPALHRALAYASFELLDLAALQIDAATALGWSAEGGDHGEPPTAEDRYFAGLYQAARVDTRSGLAAMDAALDEAPQLEIGRGVVFAMQISAGLVDEARSTLDEWAADLKPRDPRTALVEAQRLELDHRYAEALDVLLAAPDTLDDTTPPFWRHRNIGRLLLYLQRYDEARVELQRAMQLVPRDNESRCNLGLVAWHEHDLDTAERLARESLEKSHEFLPAVSLLVTCALERGQWQRALELCADARSAGIQRPGLQHLEAKVWHTLGLARTAADDREGALDAWRRAVELHPERLDAWSELAFAHWEAEEWEPARQAFAQACALWFAHPSRPRLGEGEFRNAYGNGEDLLDLLTGLFATSAACGDEAGAREALARLDEQLRGRPPSRPGTQLNLAEALALCALPALRDCARARALLDEPAALRLIDGSPGARETAVRVEAACGGSG